MFSFSSTPLPQEFESMLGLGLDRDESEIQIDDWNWEKDSKDSFVNDSDVISTFLWPNVSGLGLNSFNNSSDINRESIEEPLPIDMQFNSGYLMSIVVYSVLFVFSAIGNITVLIMLFKRRRARLVFPPMDFMLLNLAIADLMVTFLMMPLEVAWAATVYWRGGDFLCRITAFFRIFGLFLSSFVLVCLAVDRYTAVKYPMQTLAGVKRARQMIIVSWILSIFCSSPQVVIFQVEHHPKFKWYTQCVVFSSLPTKAHELAYFLFGMFFTYLGPFIIIVVLYCGIVIELIKRHKECSRQMHHNGGNELRRSGIGNIGKAKVKALKMTVIIAAIFFICWTPYYIISLWYFIDETSFRKLDPRINKALFFFACTNSTANPIVYGIFHLRGNLSNLRRDATVRQRISSSNASMRVTNHRELNISKSLNSTTSNTNSGGNQSLTVYNNANSKTNVSVMKMKKSESPEGSGSGHFNEIPHGSRNINVKLNTNSLSPPGSYV